jgi:SAM-dependent methyltransferase
MPDVYAAITEAPASVLEVLGDAMELRARDPQQQRMLADYLARIEFPAEAKVLEIGCGTGAISRRLAEEASVQEVFGVDPSRGLLERARSLAAATSRLSFMEADGRNLPFEDRSFDIVVVHTVVSHVPDPEQLVGEAWRVLRVGGTVAIFDGDYSTMTVASSVDDPLQSCADAMRSGFVTDPWVVRRLPAMTRQAGFVDLEYRSYGFAQIDDPLYMLSIVDRGADALSGRGVIGPELATALKDEARRRAAASSFFGFIAYASLLARKAHVGS